MHTVIKFDRKAWLKLCIHMNAELRKNEKNNFGKDFFKLINNVRKHRDIKLVTTEERRSYLKVIPENLLALEMKKTQIFMNKPVYIGLLMLEISKIVMYEFWYDYVKPKNGEKAKICYMDIDSFMVYIKTKNIYGYIAKDVETRFDTSVYELDRLLFKEKIRKKLV